MKNPPGMFITFEGLDGCGKSTQLGRLAEWLRRNGHEPVCTREPGGTPAGDRIRQLLLDSHTARLSPWTELALMFASRVQHLEELIWPALAQGKIVLCDRFVDSSEAYQGGGRQLGGAPVHDLHRALCRNFYPDLTILMDTEVAHSVTRARRRNQSQGRARSDEARFERENRHFFERVRSAFLAIAEREPGRVLVVDARRPLETVHREIVQLVEARLPKSVAAPRAQRARR